MIRNFDKNLTEVMGSKFFEDYIKNPTLLVSQEFSYKNNY